MYKLFLILVNLIVLYFTSYIFIIYIGAYPTAEWWQSPLFVTLVLFQSYPAIILTGTIQ